jgi:predicted metal-binding protein
MRKTVDSLESYLARLCQKARELGASQAVAIPAVDIVVDERTSLKCFVPLCPHYGIDLMCPPNVIPVSKFREILGGYHHAILIKVDIPLINKSKRKPKADYMKALEDAQKRLHDIVCQIESISLADGYHFAAGLTGGSCPLCEECIGVKSGLSCRHPYKARPAMEAMGIDVMATARKAGLDLSFGQNDSRGWVGLVLVA